MQLVHPGVLICTSSQSKHCGEGEHPKHLSRMEQQREGKPKSSPPKPARFPSSCAEEPAARTTQVPIMHQQGAQLYGPEFYQSCAVV